MSDQPDKDDLLPEAPPPKREAAPPRPAPPVVVPRWIQLLAVLFAGFALYAVA